MSERLETWGELAGSAGIDLGDTGPDAPVSRLMSTPIAVTGSESAPEFQGCGTGCACANRN